MKVYLAGPMTGIPQFNIPAFDAAAADLRARGYDVASPAELDDAETRAAALASPDGAPGSGSTNGETWGDFLARDVKLIADEGIEAIVCLPGWERSNGARLETFVGRLAGLPIFAYAPGNRLSAVDFGLLIAAHDVDLGYADASPVGDPTLITSMEDFTKAFMPVDEDVCDFVPPLAWIDSRSSGRDEEVRITDPETGGQKGQKLCQLGALDPLALIEVGRVAGFGAGKYARFNYAKGYAWSLSFDALQRHLLQWAAGEDVDEESQLSHLGHAAWHCLALLTFVLRERGTDDRLHRALETA